MMMQTTMMQHSAEVQQGHEQKVLEPVALAVAAMVVLPLVFDHPS
jgi:hypothetical protein